MAGYALHFETGVYTLDITLVPHIHWFTVYLCYICSNGETVASAHISSPAIAQRGSLKKVGYFHIPYQLTL